MRFLASLQHRTMPTSLVRVAKAHTAQNRANEATFNERWQKVLKPLLHQDDDREALNHPR
jgi:hypothetical protein